MMASSQFLSVSVTRSVVPLKLMVRGLSTASMMICRTRVYDQMVNMDKRRRDHGATNLDPRHSAA